MGVGVGEQFLVQGGRKGGEGRKEGHFLPFTCYGLQWRFDHVTQSLVGLFPFNSLEKNILVVFINFQYTFSKHISDIVNTRKTVEKI